MAAAFRAVLIWADVRASASRKETARPRRRVCTGSESSGLAASLSSNTGNAAAGPVEAGAGFRGGEEGLEGSVDGTTGSGTGLVARGAGSTGCRSDYECQLSFRIWQSIIWEWLCWDSLTRPPLRSKLTWSI